MKTEQWIELLARGAGRAPSGLAAKRLALAASVGWVASALLAIGTIGLVPVSSFGTPAPWTKLLYCGLLAIAAGQLTARMSRPGSIVQPARAAVIALPLAMAALGAIALMRAPAGSRLQALLGHSWWMCPWGVLVLSLPGLAVALWAVGGLAPTRPARTGFAAGVFAGAVGAGGYALACPETSPSFVAVWYTLGILFTGGVGALAGRHWLRW